jgi:putative pyruvate formate lyase activating enzyme
MHRQVGDLVIDGRGIAQRGLLLRHLVMPEDKATTAEAMAFVHDEISPNTYVNIMNQWRPAGETARFPEIHRCISAAEYRAALEQAGRAGIRRLDERVPRSTL